MVSDAITRRGRDVELLQDIGEFFHNASELGEDSGSSKVVGQQHGYVSSSSTDVQSTGVINKSPAPLHKKIRMMEEVRSMDCKSTSTTVKISEALCEGREWPNVCLK